MLQTQSHDQRSTTSHTTPFAQADHKFISTNLDRLAGMAHYQPSVLREKANPTLNLRAIHHKLKSHQFTNVKHQTLHPQLHLQPRHLPPQIHHNPLRRSQHPILSTPSHNSAPAPLPALQPQNLMSQLSKPRLKLGASTGNCEMRGFCS